jgi:hypothetical protein
MPVIILPHQNEANQSGINTLSNVFTFKTHSICNIKEFYQSIVNFDFDIYYLLKCKFRDTTLDTYDISLLYIAGVKCTLYNAYCTTLCC